MECRDCGVIFDMDGVLADTAEAHFQSWQSVGEVYGIKITREVFRETFGRPNHQIIPVLLDREATDEEIRGIDDAKEAAYRCLVAATLVPVPGAVELVTHLHRMGVRLGVGSSGPRENVDLVLRALGIHECFTAVITAWDVEKGKPDPDVFLKTARGLGLPACRCVVVEDVPAGIQAAHAAGMPCVAVTTTRPAADLSEAERVYADLTEVTPGEILRLLSLD
jgi:beta-phosphoglucomutase